MKPLPPLPDLQRAASLQDWLAEAHQYLLAAGGELSLGAAAERAGLSRSHLSNLLTGRRPVLSRHAEPLGRAFGFDARQTEAIAGLLVGRRPALEALAPGTAASAVAENRELLRCAPKGHWAARASVWTLSAAEAIGAFAAGEAALRDLVPDREGSPVRFILRAFPVTKPEEKFSMEAGMWPSAPLTATREGATVPMTMKLVSPSEEPDILDFLDYRDFLSRYLDAARARNHRLSYRWLGQRLGVSGAQVANVLARRRKLDLARGAEAAAGLGLTGDRADYFLLLMEYNDTADGLSAVQALRRLCLMRARNGRPLNEEVGSVLLLRWYMPVVLELSMRPGWREDPAWIAAQLRPAITPAQAVDALTLLKAAGYLGGHARSASPVARAPRWQDAATVARFHDECLDVAADTAALGLHPWQHAELSLRISDEPAAIGTASLAWSAAVEQSARSAAPERRAPDSSASTHLFLAHALRVDLPPP